MATGVLVVGVNRATRLLGQLMLTDKRYTGTVRLGVSTITDDAEGEVTSCRPVADLDDERLESALEPLRGDIRQVPSSVSAIKINGVRSYAKVRAGERVALAARPIRVSRLEVIARREVAIDGLPAVDLDIEVDCSSGSYIRALARDLGAALGCGGHLTALRRTRVGSFGLDQARTLEQAAAGLTMVSMSEVARRTFAVLPLTADQAAAVRVGRRLPDLALPATLCALLDPNGEFLALYRQRDADAVPEAVFV
jgi:tRNA pseudouridine55 synthase